MFLLMLCLCVSSALPHQPEPSPASPSIPQTQTRSSSAAFNGGINGTTPLRPHEGNGYYQPVQPFKNIPGQGWRNPASTTTHNSNTSGSHQISTAPNGNIYEPSNPGHQIDNSYFNLDHQYSSHQASTIRQDWKNTPASTDTYGTTEHGYQITGYPQSKQPDYTSDQISINPEVFDGHISPGYQFGGHHSSPNLEPQQFGQPSYVPPNEPEKITTTYGGNTYQPGYHVSGNDYQSYQRSQSGIPINQNWKQSPINNYDIYRTSLNNPEHVSNHFSSHQPGLPSSVLPNQNWDKSTVYDDNIYRSPPNNVNNGYPGYYPSQESFVPPNQDWNIQSYNNSGYLMGYGYFPGNPPTQQPGFPLTPSQWDNIASDANRPWPQGTNSISNPGAPVYPGFDSISQPVPRPPAPWLQGTSLGSNPTAPAYPGPGIVSQSVNGFHTPPAPWLPNPNSGAPTAGAAFPAAVPGTLSQPVPLLGEIHAPSLQWHVGVYTKTFTPYMQVCGGSLVKANVVLSAAHCFWNYEVGAMRPGLFAVAAGKLLRPWEEAVDSYAQHSDVKDIKIPPRFHGGATSFQDDIAILMLTSPFEYASGVQPVCVSFDLELERRQLTAFNMGTVAGWGLTQPNGLPSQRLNFLKLPYVEIDRCVQSAEPGFLKYITSDKICAGDQSTGRALCRGDSGGGLVYYSGTIPYLRGIASTAPRDESGNECNAYAIASFTHVRAHRTFLEDHVPDIAEGCETLYGNGNSTLLQSKQTSERQSESQPIVSSVSNNIMTKPIQHIQQELKINMTTEDRTQGSQVISTIQETSGTHDRRQEMLTVAPNRTTLVVKTLNQQTKTVMMSVGRGERGVVTVPVDGASTFICDCFCKD